MIMLNPSPAYEVPIDTRQPPEEPLNCQPTNVKGANIGTTLGLWVAF